MSYNHFPKTTSIICGLKQLLTQKSYTEEEGLDCLPI